ncbi:MAG: NTP transferase domain-containing protein [Planctomycetota bacterium]
MKPFSILGVILARAGSKGLANKHLRPLLGRPVISYTFEHIKRSRSLTRVVVSTDCPQIKQLAREAGLTTIQRPADLAGDDASVQDALLHALDEVERRGSFRADAIASLYGNVPVRPADVTDRCVEMLRGTDCCSVRTFQPVGKWHPTWMARLADDGKVEACVPGSIHRRQELEPLFLHDGGGLVMSRQSLEFGRERRDDPHAMFGNDRRGITVPSGDVVEVDVDRDLALAEAILRHQGFGQPAVRLAA